MKFQDFKLNNSEKVVVIWRWATNGIFYVHSFYEWLEYGGIPYSEFTNL